MDKIIKDKSIKIWESNTLAIAPINRILEPNSMRLFLWSIYQATNQKTINKRDELEVKFSLKEFANYFGINSNNTYSFAKIWLKKIQEYQYFIADDVNEELTARIIIPNANYKNGVVKLVFNGYFTEHLTKLKSNKIFIELNHLRKIKNPRFIKLYEYFKAKVFAGQKNRIIKITLENIRKLLVIKNKQYEKYADIQRWVIKPLIKEFQKIDDIVIEKWEPIKLGRKVVSINFWITNNSHKILSDDEKKEITKEYKIVKCKKCFEGKYKIRENANFDDNEERFFYGCNKYPECKSTLTLKEYDNNLKM